MSCSPRSRTWACSGAPGLGAPAADVRAAYADTALGVVTTAAGALSLACYVVFAALIADRRSSRADESRGGTTRAPFVAALAGAALAFAGIAAAALLVAGGDPALFDVQLVLRYLAGPFMAVFLLAAATAMPAPLRVSARVLAVPLALTPLAIAGLELGAQLAFASHAAWIWAAGLWLVAGGPGLVRRAAFLMLVLAAGMVGAALLIVPDATATFFAWGLKPAALAAFAGGVYVGSAVVYAAGLRASRREAQPLVVAAVVLSVSVLAATFAHLDVFDFDRLQAWAWVALFAAFGVTTTGLAITGPWRREPGPALPPAARGVLAAAALALAAAGVALWIDPAAYDLPPLGGRFAGSWAAMLAVLAAWPAVRGRRDEARLPALALVALPAGALARGTADGRGAGLRRRARAADPRRRGRAQRGTGCRGSYSPIGPYPGTSTLASTPHPWSDGSDTTLTSRSRSACERRVEVVGHQVQLMLRLAVGRVDGELGGRQREDQPAAAGVDRVEVRARPRRTRARRRRPARTGSSGPR